MTSRNLSRGSNRIAKVVIRPTEKTGIMRDDLVETNEDDTTKEETDTTLSAARVLQVILKRNKPMLTPRRKKPSREVDHVAERKSSISREPIVVGLNQGANLGARAHPNRSRLGKKYYVVVTVAVRGALTHSLPCFSVNIKHKNCKENINYVQQQHEHHH